MPAVIVYWRHRSTTVSFTTTRRLCANRVMLSLSWTLESGREGVDCGVGGDTHQLLYRSAEDAHS